MKSPSRWLVFRISICIFHPLRLMLNGDPSPMTPNVICNEDSRIQKQHSPFCDIFIFSACRNWYPFRKTFHFQHSTLQGRFIIPRFGGGRHPPKILITLVSITIFAQKIFYGSLYFTQGFQNIEDIFFRPPPKMLLKFFAPLRDA